MGIIHNQIPFIYYYVLYNIPYCYFMVFASMFADFLTNDEISQLIGKRLRAKRLSGNILIDQLADRCGVNRKTIIEVEAGKDVKLSSLIKIMRGLQAIGNLEAAFPDLLPGTEGISSRGQPRLKASIGRKKHAK